MTHQRRRCRQRQRRQRAVYYVHVQVVPLQGKEVAHLLLVVLAVVEVGDRHHQLLGAVAVQVGNGGGGQDVGVDVNEGAA